MLRTNQKVKERADKSATVFDQNEGNARLAHGVFGYFTMLNVADSPVMLSFPHFYLADPKLLEAVEGISPPDPEKHQLYIDVQPVSQGVDLNYLP